MTNSQRIDHGRRGPAPRQPRLPAAITGNLDLLLVALICVALGIALLASAPSLVRLPLTIVFVVIVPGYTLDVALWPKRDVQDFVERAALSVALSLTIVGIVGLALNATWGIRVETLYIGLCVPIIACGVACFFRRRLEEPSAADATPHPLLWQRWGILRTAGLAAAVALLLAGTAFAAARRPQDRLTEFTLFNAQGTVAADYPSQVQTGQTITLPAAVVNREGTESRYQIVVQTDETEIGRTDEFALADGKTWSGHVNFTPRTASPYQRIDIFLLKDGGTQPYRRLSLWMEIDPPAPSAGSGA